MANDERASSDAAPLVVADAVVLRDARGRIVVHEASFTLRAGEIVGVAEMPLGRVIGIGFIQCLSMIPGVSRSGATILGGLSLGVERRTQAVARAKALGLLS